MYINNKIYNLFSGILKYFRLYLYQIYFVFMGYVYLLKDINNDTYKIGVTRKMDGKRLMALQTGNSTKLELIMTYKTEYPFRLESMLHRKFEQYRENNEWFRLPDDIVEGFHFYINQLHDIIISLKDNPYFNKNLK